MRKIINTALAVFLSAAASQAATQKITASGDFTDMFFLPTDHRLEIEIVYDDAIILPDSVHTPISSMSLKFLDRASGVTEFAINTTEARAVSYYGAGISKHIIGFASDSGPYFELDIRSDNDIGLGGLAGYVNSSATANNGMLASAFQMFNYGHGGAIIDTASAVPLSAQVPVPASLPLLLGGVAMIGWVRRGPLRGGSTVNVA